MDGPAKMVVAKKGRENVYAILFAAFTKSYYYSNRGLLFTIFIAKTTGCSIRKLSMTVAPQQVFFRKVCKKSNRKKPRKF